MTNCWLRPAAFLNQLHLRKLLIGRDASLKRQECRNWTFLGILRWKQEKCLWWSKKKGKKKGIKIKKAMSLKQHGGFLPLVYPQVFVIAWTRSSCSLIWWHLWHRIWWASWPARWPSQYLPQADLTRLGRDRVQQTLSSSSNQGKIILQPNNSHEKPTYCV